MYIPIIVGALFGLSILLVFIGAARGATLDRERLELYVGEQWNQKQSSRRSTGLGNSANELVQGFDKLLRSVSAAERLAQALLRAGLRVTISEYLLIWLACIAIGMVVAHSIIGNWWLSLPGGLLGAALPYFFLRFRQAGRLQVFNNQLNNVLMQLSGSLRAGYALLQAIDLVSHEMPAPAGPEFGLVVRDVKLGRATLEALDDLADRVGSDDLALIVTAIRIHYETGGNLATVLDNIAETIRERTRLKGEIKSLTAMQRYSGYVLAVLPFLVFLILMLINPSYEMHLFDPGLTLVIPVLALVSMIMGFLIIRSIVNIEL
jgi:tight adherence protein B